MNMSFLNAVIDLLHAQSVFVKYSATGSTNTRYITDGKNIVARFTVTNIGVDKPEIAILLKDGMKVKEVRGYHHIMRELKANIRGIGVLLTAPGLYTLLLDGEVYTFVSMLPTTATMFELTHPDFNPITQGI